MVEPLSQHASQDEPEPDEQARPRSGRRRKAKKQRSFWVELPILIVIALVLAFVFQQFFAKVYTIPSGSMESTLHGCTGCYGDKILVDKIVYDFTEPTPGEVVVFKGPQPWLKNDMLPEPSSNAFVRFLHTVGSAFGLAPPDERDFVKRVIATAGQTVQCCDAKNRVVVDGKALDEPYLHWESPSKQYQQDFPPRTVPPNSLFVLGDNRNNSCDSRCQGDKMLGGMVPVDNVIGKARIIVLPPGRWGGVSDHDPQANAQPTAVAAGLSAPSWQQGIPIGFGALAAWPVLAGGRKLVSGVRKAGKKR
ncbi:signal peptidase I [Amycolatopsis minnesotensis]|uniref:Signal peptidase I n=1 Tax=Amycolatopsis minnesotensis TaxID=337894 RepID=A0ABN2Q6P3_9PSEU